MNNLIMKRRKLLGISLAFALILGLATVAFAATSVIHTGVVYYDPAKAYPGYTLLDGGVLQLIDMNGNVVKDWTRFKPYSERSGRAILLPNGNIMALRGGEYKEGVPDIIELDWDGNLVWSYMPSNNEKAHHDIRRLENGNTLFLLFHNLSPAETAAAGIRDFPGNEWFPPMKRTGIVIMGDKIVEVNPAGEVVWEWSTFGDPWFDINRFSLFDSATDWTHGNTCSVIPENKWYDAGDQRFKPGNIIFNPRNFDEFVIIDKETKQVVWSYKSDFWGGLAHPHEPIMIEKGLPGAGNILVFDNGLGVRHRGHNGQSYVLEINPVEKEIVWRYGASNFFSTVGAVMHRLPNGNTLIVETVPGRIFQVTPEGEVVWEWMGRGDNAIARVGTYPYDYCPQFASLPRSENAVPLPAGTRALPRRSFNSSGN